MMASFHCCSTSPPPPNTNDDIEQSPAQGGITVEGDLEQLNRDSVRPDNLSVRSYMLCKSQTTVPYIWTQREYLYTTVYKYYNHHYNQPDRA